MLDLLLAVALRRWVAASWWGGPAPARSLTELGLIDVYRIYLHPVVLGSGKPYFAGPRAPLRLVSSDGMARR
ncbi:MAG: dihydrofolate reductase family protein [Polaromonas sp.]